MRRIPTLGFTVLSALAACGGDPPAGVDAAPPAITMANMNGAPVGMADWGCLGTASADRPSTQAIALSGRLRDFQASTMGVGNATLTAFPGIMLAGNSGMATSSNVTATRGDYAVTLAMLPPGETRYGFKIEAAGYLKTYLLNQYRDPAIATQTLNISAVSESTGNALPAFVGVTRDPAKGVLAGAMRDCLGREVSNAIATVSSTSGTRTDLAGADTYYFASGLPARHTVVSATNTDGLFVILNLPPQAAPAFTQVWGYRTEAEAQSGTMTLLGELPSPIEANAIITGSFEPRRI